IFNGPYPQTETFEAGATPAADLASDLLGNLTIETTLSAELGGLDIVLDTILGLLGVNLNSPINDTLMPLVESLVRDASGLLNPILEPLLADLVTPLLDELGIGLGQMEVTVVGVGDLCPALEVSKTHTGIFTAGETGIYTILVTNTGSLTTSAPIV